MVRDGEKERKWKNCEKERERGMVKERLGKWREG